VTLLENHDLPEHGVENQELELLPVPVGDAQEGKRDPRYRALKRMPATRAWAAIWSLPGIRGAAPSQGAWRSPRWRCRASERHRPHLEVRLEYRIDHSSVPVFYGGSQNDNTLPLALLAWF